MARSGARRRTSTAARPQQRRERARQAPRTEYSAVESAMFFPKLRRQAKWMFVFLALVFAVGFVVFGVGAGAGGTGIGDLLRGGGSSSNGPSVGDAQSKIKKGDLTAYKELTDAYRNQGKADQAIAAGEQYVKYNPKDYDFMRTLASDYEGKANQQRDQAAAVQNELTSTTGGATFALSQSSLLGRALGSGGRIDQELTTAANTQLTQLYSAMQSEYSRAASLYQQVAAVKRSDVLLQLLLAEAAYQARQNNVAIAAYKRVIKLAPGSAEAQQARQQVQLLKLQSSPKPTHR